MATAADLRAALDGLGLGFLFDIMNGAVLDPTVDVTDENQLTNAINTNPDAKKALDERFIGNKYRKANNLRELKPKEYLALEQSYLDVLSNNGMPAGFYDSPTDLAKLVGGGTSPIEFQARIQQGYKAALAAPQNVKKQLEELYGVTESEIAAYFLDPTKAQDIMGRTKSADLFSRQIEAAQISAQAQQQAGMTIGVQTAEELAAQGMTGVAAERFATISEQQGLFAPQMAGEEAVSQAEQIGAAFGTNAAARQAIEKRRRRRTAAFEGGGGVSETQQGVVGLRTVGQ